MSETNDAQDAPTHIGSSDANDAQDAPPRLRVESYSLPPLPLLSPLVEVFELYVAPVDENDHATMSRLVKEVSQRRTTDLGFDLVVQPPPYNPNTCVQLWSTGVCCIVVSRFVTLRDTYPCPGAYGFEATRTKLEGSLLYARSSSQKLGWGLGNSVGIIDPGYIGEIRAGLYPITSWSGEERDHTIAGTRAVQLVAPNHRPWYQIRAVNRHVIAAVVDTLHAGSGDAARGTGGFGSTGSS